MFDFFEKIAEGIGFKIVDKFSEKVSSWIAEVFEKVKEDNNNEDQNNVANSGRYSNVANSGRYSNVANSGRYSNVANSGDNSNVANSGRYSNVANSGDNSNVANSGDNSNVANSGDDSNVANSGRYSNVANSGRYSNVANSGDDSNVANSGYGSKVVISGNRNVAMLCGINNIVQAKNGTWISIAEFKREDIEEDDYRIVPKFALSAQIGNEEYKDYKGKVLNEDTFYCLYNKEFHPVEEYDGIRTIELSRKVRDGITIIKGIAMCDLYDKEIAAIYIVVEGKLSAHGRDLKQAMDDLVYKKTKSEETQKIVEEIKKTGKVTRAQYRAITGACQFGTEQFCKQHNIQDLEAIELTELKKILTPDNYGAKKFWESIGE